MDQKDVEKFARLIEECGYGEGALQLLQNDLIPLAKENRISLYEAVQRYSDPDADQDTSYYQLFYALCHMPSKRIGELGIHDPL